LRPLDVLIENFRPGSLAELGFDYGRCRRQSTADLLLDQRHGQTGPHAQSARLRRRDSSEAGIMAMTGFPGGEPTRVASAITDYLAGLYAMQDPARVDGSRAQRPRAARRHRALRRDLS